MLITSSECKTTVHMLHLTSDVTVIYRVEVKSNRTNFNNASI